MSFIGFCKPTFIFNLTKINHWQFLEQDIIGKIEEFSVRREERVKGLNVFAFLFLLKNTYHSYKG